MFNIIQDNLYKAQGKTLPIKALKQALCVRVLDKCENYDIVS